jgi:RNA polymerase sigma-70 factor, ECF subfamily
MQNTVALREASRQQLWIATQHSVDLILLDRIADGDKLAMKALFARHYLSVYRLVLRLVTNEAFAEDIVIEAFVDVWRNAKRFQGNNQVSSWITAIAQFKAISSLRQRKDEPFDEGEATTIQHTSDDPEIAVQKKGRAAMLGECVSYLSRDHRSSLLPRQVGGRSRPNRWCAERRRGRSPNSKSVEAQQ